MFCLHRLQMQSWATRCSPTTTSPTLPSSVRRQASCSVHLSTTPISTISNVPLSTLTCSILIGWSITLALCPLRILWSASGLCCRQTFARISKFVSRLPQSITNSSQLMHSLSCLSLSRALKDFSTSLVPL